MNSGRAVLVTGASTGIGYATALLLAQSGYTVFGGVRSPQDAQRLRNAHQRIQPIQLDITRSDEIAAAAEHIRLNGTPLYGLVNNAGIAVAGPLEYLPMDEIRRAFEVNVFGALAMTQAALPLLRAANGRIIFMSSVSGQIAPPLLGPYAASKFALEAFADSMRMELSAFGIPVSVIQPGNVRTPIWGKGRQNREALAERMPAQALERYGAGIDALLRITEREEHTGMDPSVIAFTVLTALHARRPHARYAVGAPAGWQRRMAMLLPERLRDRLILRTMSNDI
ncbi:MAG TPA: SDR family oxidoreductase [Candidatus Baltobacteraceae bacterium]|jgi:NAD(P)-dependent dehydrogenase (short-subunit alcohol dehydrogenase family)|nr:SDR family oxidoreductase [Candidatus Baltobacteraceae bacterium]